MDDDSSGQTHTEEELVSQEIDVIHRDLEVGPPKPEDVIYESKQAVN